MKSKAKIVVAVIGICAVAIPTSVIINIMLNSTPTLILINHDTAHLEDLQGIPEEWITKAKENLHIAYFHTSHGSQLSTGMSNLDTFMGGIGLYSFSEAGGGGSLHYFEPDEDDGYPYGIRDLTDYTDQFHTTTSSFLNANPQYNVIMWSWCGLETGEAEIDEYLANMNWLESQFPLVSFVYMTGHLDGSGETGAVHLANERIRNFCIPNNKILYDFADIESYNPDDIYFLDDNADDNCTYDGGNWALQWQESHTQDVD